MCKIITTIRDYYSVPRRIERIERQIQNCHNFIGTDYHNPLGRAFDICNSQQEWDDSFRHEAKRLEKKLEKLKQCIN